MRCAALWVGERRRGNRTLELSIRFRKVLETGHVDRAGIGRGGGVLIPNIRLVRVGRVPKGTAVGQSIGSHCPHGLRAGRGKGIRGDAENTGLITCCGVSGRQQLSSSRVI